MALRPNRKALSSVSLSARPALAVRLLAWRRNAYVSHAANAWLDLMRESLDAGPTPKGQSRDTRRAQMVRNKAS